MAKLKIYSDIVDEEGKAFLSWAGMDGMAFTDIDRFIADIPEDDDNISLTINCRGGLTDTALAMYDALRATGKTISAEVIGECSSSATLLLLAARKDLRRAHPNASILIHNPYISGYVEGDAKQIGNLAESLEDVRNKFLDIYVDRTGASREVLSQMMDEDKPMSVAKAIELGFISEQILPISAKNKKMSLKHKIINALANALGVYGMTLETADGKTLELEKESGEPVVGDVVVSEDGEYIMPDGSTIVVDGGVIVEIRSGEEAAEPERGEESDTPEEGEEKSDDAEVDRLKAEIAEKDAKIDELNAEIEELRAKLDEANANAKSEDDAAVLDMVATAGGMDWLKRIQSNGKPEERATDSTSLDKLTDKKAQKMSFAEFHESRKNNKNKK